MPSRNDVSAVGNMPTVHHPRSKFPIAQKHMMTGNVGELRCHYLYEVLPGDTCRISDSKVVRLQTPVTPFMDNLYLDTYYFFVPTRLIWSHWKNFMGESESAWYDDENEYTVPQISCPEGGWSVNSLACDFGIVPNVDNIELSALPFRAYAKIYDDWFRSTPLMDALYIPVGDSTQTGTNTLSNYITDIANGAIATATKFTDIFTLALPAPQRGPQVEISIGQISDTAPVVGNGKALGLTNGTDLGALYFKSSDVTKPGTNAYGKDLGTTVDNSSLGSSGQVFGVPTKTLLGDNIANSGLVADINISGASIISVNELRNAFQIQKYFEVLARTGDRYIEQIKALFGVNSPDARLQRSEYLGGATRIPLKVIQVPQTSATTDGSTPQGTTAAYSLTADTSFAFEKSFTEHGYILGLSVVRYNHSYQQGIPRMFSRKTRFDYYTPLLQSIGEVGIKNKEIYAQGSTVINESTGIAYDEEIFGYQEAWYEYRYGQDIISGEFNSNYSLPLDSWHFGDDYSSLPALSADWIVEDKNNVDRVLAIQSSTANQWFADFEILNEAIRVLPVHSIPGMIDHYA